jgi:hypothetical protein
VFDAPISYSDGSGLLPSLANVRDPKYYETLHPPLSAKGMWPFGAYLIRKQGKVELGQLSCSVCHTRVLPDGTVVKGAQSNLPFDKTVKYNAPTFMNLPLDAQKAMLARLTALSRINYGMPWLNPIPPTPIGT